ncbi:hypothetical protein [Pseudomonas mohnii]
MFETAGIRLMRRVYSALSIVSLAVLLGACAHPSPPDPGEPKSWIVKNVASKTTEELYRDSIAPAVYKRSGSQIIGSYTVESGNLITPDNSIGSLVTVRGIDGSLTAMIEEKGRSGLVTINSKGEGRFTPSPPQDFSRPDIVNVGDAKDVEHDSVTEEPAVVDIFLGYSRAAADAVGGDAMADALAKVESVNLALRNSKVATVSLKLVGIQVVDRNYPITTETLSNLPTIFQEGIRGSQPDLIHGIFLFDSDSTGGGWGDYRGRKAISHAIGEAFRHEVGHNAGGAHCFSQGGAISLYAYGYNNGKTTTIQCGNESPFYSNPFVKDAHNLPLGNALTANMARVWRNNASRLSSYAPVKAPEGFAKTGSTSDSVSFKWEVVPQATNYEIYQVKNSDPQPKKIGDSSKTNFVAWNVLRGMLYFVKAVDSVGNVSRASNSVVDER